MLCENSRVRIKGSAAVGTVVEFEPGSDTCMVELDSSWGEHGAYDPFEVGLSEIDELVEAVGPERRELCEQFDFINLYASVSLCIGRYYHLTAEKTDNGYRVFVANCSKQEGAPVLLEGEDAARFRSEVHKMGADRWIEPFYSKDWIIKDGYGWDMEVFAGNRYFTCSGSNVTPPELLDFVDYVASLGLLRIDVFDE